MNLDAKISLIELTGIEYQLEQARKENAELRAQVEMLRGELLWYKAHGSSTGSLTDKDAQIAQLTAERDAAMAAWTKVETLLTETAMQRDAARKALYKAAELSEEIGDKKHQQYRNCECDFSDTTSVAIQEAIHNLIAALEARSDDNETMPVLS